MKGNDKDKIEPREMLIGEFGIDTTWLDPEMSIGEFLEWKQTDQKKTLEAIEKLVNEYNKFKMLVEECGAWVCCGLLLESAFPIHPDKKQCWEVNIGTDAWCPICLAHAILHLDKPPGRAAEKQGGIPNGCKQKDSTE